jgi:hypothetical protein
MASHSSTAPPPGIIFSAPPECRANSPRHRGALAPEDFTSYRRQGGETGRQISVVGWLPDKNGQRRKSLNSTVAMTPVDFVKFSATIDRLHDELQPSDSRHNI